MALFTFIADCEGESSVRQVSGENLHEAALKWIAAMFDHEPPDLGLAPDDENALITQFEEDLQQEDLATPIDRCKGAWRLNFIDRTHARAVRVVVVKTAE